MPGQHVHVAGGGQGLYLTLLAIVKLLSQDQQLKIHFNALEGSYAICLTANLVHLVSLAPSLASSQLVPVVTTITHLLSSLGQ